MPNNIVPFNLPKKPRVRQQDAPPDQRKIAVIPIRACTDKQLTHGMIKALILICSYMNRSGITWVSQKTLAERMGISQQAISKHLVKLTKAGYLEILKRPVPGEKHTTWRVIFDPSISAEDAISITSAIEDTRPPYMKEKQAMEAEQPDPEGQRRVAQLIAKALKQPPKKEHTMPKEGQTRTVKAMHQEIAKTKQKRSPKGTHAQPPEVVHHAQPPAVDNSSHAQPFEGVRTTSEGCIEHKNKGYIESIKVDISNNLNTVLNNQNRIELRKAGLSDVEIEDNLEHLLAAYEAEGLTPNPDRLVGEILQLSKVGQ